VTTATTARYYFPGKPQSQARPRFGGGRVYDPKKVAKEEIAWLIHEQKTHEPFEGAVLVDLTFDFGKGRGVTMTVTEIDEGRIKRPDIDNLAKFYMDAANGILWGDDSQVAELKARKV